ncbi:MAG: MFS transporter [Euryarchaeota archaeon]|nr:MFS transporter [Euryarchaeota archaeon]MDE1835144.1 MFS transporter [Euryarchaeota archaeon]MDE1881463.1 MFS transporter [Euryarchaeota archaeon]MDE2046207.1 MFS transporter [Thermoplasmata archaeon]
MTPTKDGGTPTPRPKTQGPGHDPHAKTAETFDRRYAYGIIALMAGMVMTVMYIEGMLTPSLPQIKDEFGVDYGQVSLVLSAYLVTGVALSPIAGKLGDVYGKKRVLTFVLVIYAAAVSVTGFSPTFPFMVGSRAVQGVGLTVFPLAMSLVREEFPREMIPRAQGLLSGLFGAGFAVSLPLGAFVSNTWGWRWTYHSAIPLVILLTVLAFVYLRESPYRRPNAFVDYLGAAFLAGSLSFIVLGLSQGPVWGWTQWHATSVLGLPLGVPELFAAGILLLLPTAYVEVWYHRASKEIILDPRLLGMRNVLVVNLIITIAGFGMFLGFQAITFLLSDPTSVGGYALDTFHIGLSFIAFAVPMLIFAPLASILITKTGTKPLTIVGSLVGAIGFLLATQTHSLDELLAAMFVTGAGIAVLNASVINLLVLTVEPREMGLATSMNGTFRNLGSSLGAPLAGSIMSTYIVYAKTQVPGVPVPVPVPYPGSTAFLYTFMIAAVVMAFAGVLAVFGREILGKRAVRGALASDERDPQETDRGLPSQTKEPAVAASRSS